MGGILSSNNKVKDTKQDNVKDLHEPLINNNCYVPTKEKEEEKEKNPDWTKADTPEEPERIKAGSSAFELTGGDIAQQKHTEMVAQQGRYEAELTHGLTVDTYWKNLPPPGCDVFWLYSSHAGTDYYFMTASDANSLEQAYQRGYDSGRISAVGAYINFRQGKQISSCGGISRNARRLSKAQYEDIQEQYKEFFNKRDVLWCLKCKKHFLLYSPKYQLELDIAYRNGTTLCVKINDRYSYEIDPRYYTQKNTSTGKVRDIARVYPNCNDMPIYGSHFLKFDKAEAPSIMEQSNIYVKNTSWL